MPELKDTLKTLKLNESSASVVLGAVVVLVVGILALNWFNGVKKTPGLVSEKAAQESAQNQLEAKPAEGTVHIVSQGESLWMISEKYFAGSGYNWADIAKANKLSNPSQILVGQKLAIPSVAVRRPVTMTTKPEVSPIAIAGTTHVTVRGDSLWKVAVSAYGDGFQWQKLYTVNKASIGRDPGKIAIGMTLSIPR